MKNSIHAKAHFRLHINKEVLINEIRFKKHRLKTVIDVGVIGMNEVY